MFGFSRITATKSIFRKVQYRNFSQSKLLLAQEDPAAARTARLKEFIKQMRENERVCSQLRSVQLIIASKVKSTDKEPTIMEQMQLLTDKEVRAEMIKLSDVMKEENVNIKKEDVGFLMQCLKAQMDNENK